LSFRAQICSLVTLVQRYVSNKLEVSTAFPLRVNRSLGSTGRADRRTGAHLTRPRGRTA